MENNMPAWTARAYQGPLANIEAARAALQAALEAGTYTAHQLDLVRPPLGEPPTPPALMQEGECTFGFAIAEGVEYLTPEGCREINPCFAALVLGIGGLSSEPTEDPPTP